MSARRDVALVSLTSGDDLDTCHQNHRMPRIEYGATFTDCAILMDRNLSTMACECQEGPREACHRREMEMHIAWALYRLSVAERTVVIARFWNTSSLSEVGKVMGIRRERVRQIEMKAIKKLRIMAPSTGLMDFYADI